MRTVKIGIIGCGGIANGKYMPSLKQIEGVQYTSSKRGKAVYF